MNADTQGDTGSPEKQQKCFSAMFAHFSPIPACLGSPFHQNLGVGCQKELGENVCKQGHLFSTIQYLALEYGRKYPMLADSF